MDYKNKYLKYKNKYLNLKLSGGSYTINDIGKKETIYVYDGVTILSKRNIGSGGSGSVNLGKILECKLNPSLVGKKVAIKSFFNNDTKEIEKQKMIEFKLDEEGNIYKNELIARLYFDINTEPMGKVLVYEYGGNMLYDYIHSEYYNIKNNLRLLKQIFTILNTLINKDNMHNDIKVDNMVFDVDINDKSLVNFKLIDFGSSVSIKRITNGEHNFTKRTNMCSPEAITNHLFNNNISFEYDYKRIQKFNKWYYYPFISILCFLLTNKEYSTGIGGTRVVDDFIGNSISHTDNRIKTLEILKDNNILKLYLDKNNILNEKYKIYKKDIEYLIDGMCKIYPDERLDENSVLQKIDEMEKLD